MRRLSKIMAFVIAIAMVLAMVLPVMAEGTNSITVDVNFKGQTYKLYKLFNATVNSEREGKTDSGSESSVTDSGISYTLIDDTGHALSKVFTVTKADGSEVTVKAGDWFEYVNESDKNIQIKAGADITTEEFRLWAQQYGEAVGSELTAASDNDANIKWTGLDDGYYFITTTTGTLVTVDSVAPNAIVKDKNTPPTIDKTVEEDSSSEYQKQNDAEIGQTVNFKTVIYAKKGGSGYKLMDKMGTGITFDGVDSIKVYKGSVSDENLVAKGDATWNAAAGGDYYAGADGQKEADAATFTLTFAQQYIDSLTADTELIVTYSATVNSDAVINTAIPNKTTLEYGNETHTAESETKTFVWGIDLLKKDGSDSSKKLADAEFVLCRKVTENGTDSIFYAKFDADQKLTGWTIADTENVANLVKKEKDYFTSKEATVLKTDADGKFAVTGLDEGSYFLIEVTAPAGYNKLDHQTDVTVSSTVASDGTKLEKDLTSGTNGSTHVDVDNNQGTILPSTGGIGTTIFYVVGAILVIGAGVVLITRRRMKND